MKREIAIWLRRLYWNFWHVNVSAGEIHVMSVQCNRINSHPSILFATHALRSSFMIHICLFKWNLEIRYAKNETMFTSMAKDESMTESQNHSIANIVTLWKSSKQEIRSEKKILHELLTHILDNSIKCWMYSIFGFPAESIFIVHNHCSGSRWMGEWWLTQMNRLIWWIMFDALFHVLFDFGYHSH